MLMKNLWKIKATTDEEFEKSMKGRVRLCILTAIGGLAAVVISLLFVLGETGHHASFMGGLYSGVGGSITALSIIYALQGRNIIKDKVRLHKKRLESQDERTLLITQKSMSMAAFVMIVILYVGILVAGFVNMVAFWTIFVIAMLGIIVYIIATVYFEHKL